MSPPLRRGCAASKIMFAALFTLALASCGGSSDSSATASEPAPEATTQVQPPDETAQVDLVSFAAKVQPIITATCARCHTQDGPGTAVLRMDTAEDIAANAFGIAANVHLRVMPPWPATELSVPFADDWSLSEEEIQAIVSWEEAGAPLDVDPTTPIVADIGVVGLDDIDDELFGDGAYDGELGQPDEYRCLVYDPALHDGAHIQSFEFVPDQTEVVHHAIGYLIPGEARSGVAALTAEDEQPGWSCFGSSRLGQDEIFLGWAPGQIPTRFDEGSGLFIGPDDFMVMQIHYHFEVEVPADHSSLKLKYTTSNDVDEILVGQYVAPAEIPCSGDESGPLCERDAAMARAVAKYGIEGAPADSILAGCGFAVTDFALDDDGMVSARCDQPVDAYGKVISVLGHEHELGSGFRITINPDTPDELILLDIDHWQFDWQFNYRPVDDIFLEPGDFVRLECRWDRSLRDADLEPAYVLWADGTNDEMCFSTIVTREVSE